MLATIALAVIGPTPGMAARRTLRGSWREGPAAVTEVVNSRSGNFGRERAANRPFFPIGKIPLTRSMTAVALVEGKVSKEPRQSLFYSRSGNFGQDRAANRSFFPIGKIPLTRSMTAAALVEGKESEEPRQSLFYSRLGNFGSESAAKSAVIPDRNQQTSPHPLAKPTVIRSRGSGVKPTFMSLHDAILSVAFRRPHFVHTRRAHRSSAVALPPNRATARSSGIAA